MSDCEYAATDIPARYLRETLDPAAAESFETHYFACDRCWSELETGVAVRGSRPVRAPARRRSFRIPLTIAATAILVVISAWVVVDRRTADQPTVFRGGSAPAISISITARGEDRFLLWNKIANATSYTVILFKPDGTELHRVATTNPNISLKRPGRIFVRVEAADANGETIATSSLQPVDATE
jgi:hypothetical protein